MSLIASILNALDERTISRNVGIAHDEARMQYPLSSNTVPDIETFFQVIGHYYQFHHSRCVSMGGRLSQSQARSLAKEALDREYRRRHGDIVTAFNDGHDGTNHGMRGVLDLLAESLKSLAVEHYVRDVFDRHVAPNSWETKLQVITEFISACGPHLARDIRADQPARYARDFEPLIRTYVEALKSTSTVFRRL